MKLSARDIMVSGIIAVLCAALIYLYVQERGRITLRSDQAPLGTIVFRKLAATRRLSGSLLWERIRNNSPVYEADTLRTGDASEATVCFDDGTGLDMYEDSMLRLQFLGPQRRLEFLGGDISVSGSTGDRNADLSGIPTGAKRGGASNAYTITAGGKTIAFSESSQASLSRTGDTLSVEVAAGQVGVTHADGTSQTITRSQELQVDLASGTSRVVERSVLPLLPEQNARLLAEHAGSAEIPFSWQTQGGASVTVEVSENKDFDSPVISAPAAGNSLNLTIDPGSWYWRVRAADGAFSSVRRLTLFAELPPRLILPAAGAEVWYRKTLPDIRFSWSQMPDAAAYIFEIAPDPQLAKPVLRNRTTLEGITVSSLPEGTWYWRVSPVYAMSLLGDKAEPEVRAFVIRRRAEMAALTPTMPMADSLFLVQEAAAKGVAFSWVPDPEAVEYEVSASRSRNMDNAAVVRTSPQAWLTLSGSEAAAFEQPATWYWAVRWKDGEGNLSPYSQPRQLRGIDGALAVRLSFPPDGYTIADSLIGGTRFAWKCNVAAKAVFQLSSDPSFSTVEWEDPSDAGTLIGRQWKTGTWYWRIRTLNADGSALHDTEARMFRVVDPLPEPGLNAPAPGVRLHLRMEDPYTISWAPVEGADYYRFGLYEVPAHGDEVLRYGVPVQKETSIELPFGEFPEGRYAVLLQAFGLDKETSTRIIGYLARSEFSFKRISRMELSTPAPNAVFEGLDARRHGINLSWRVPDAPDSSELLISSDPQGRTVLLRGPGGSGKALIERLAAGDYYWTAKGKLYGFDISALTTNRFTVRAIPLLPAPSGLFPARGFQFGAKELWGLSSLRFEWEAVPDATRYVFALYRGADASPLIHSDALAEHLYELADLSVLDNGEYRWTVRAQAFDAKGELEQEGRPVESRFRIELPQIQAPALKENETFYGR